MADRVRETGGEYGDGTVLVASLRAAMRRASSALPENELPRERAILEAAVRPLLDRFYVPLLVWCNDLAGGAGDIPGRAHLEGADLAQEAWARVLRYLGGPNGGRVRDDTHFARLLRCAARNYLYDLLDSAAFVAEAGAVALDAPENNGDSGDSSGGDRRLDRMVSETAVQPGLLRFAALGANADLIEALFAGEDRFRRTARIAGVRRHAKQFRAYVLYELGLFLQRETEGAPSDAIEEVLGLMRDFAAACAVPADWWDEIEMIALTSAGNGIGPDSDYAAAQDELIMDAANRLCGASLRSGNLLSVLRHDLNQCALVWGRTRDGRASQ